MTTKDNDNGSTRSSLPSDVPSEDHDGRTCLYFAPDDPESPYNWSSWKKCFVVLVSILTVTNSTVSSGLASNSSAYFGEEWGITSRSLLILPTSLFLVGYVLGPIVFGPLSESYGRKDIMVVAFTLYTLFTLGCALAPNFASFVILRFITGIFAACPIAVVGGTCADVYKTAESRGRAMAIFMGATTFGPCAGPIISGYLSPSVGWRWSFWTSLIYAGVTAVPLLLVPETFAPILLRTRARKIRKETGEDTMYAPIEHERKDMAHIITVVLTRPVRMFLFEAIVLFSCLYLAFAYGIFYMFFQAFPIIFTDIYGFTPGQEGLVFLSIGVGACIAIGIYILWDMIMARARARNARWARSEEMNRLPLACFAGPFLIASCFWMGWSARADVHWIVPVLGGVPFGIGYLLIFMALLNYLVDAYKIFAASAMAAASMVRSAAGAVLPFAARPMYTRLGVPWACSLLGFLSVAMAVIPFVFIWKGTKLRQRSKFCQYLLQREREEEEARVGREVPVVFEEEKSVDVRA
ncbi:MFS general substrate transporter [Trichodelitschia bisporula]|uniref:MFS general substrate transporter n=1 Tax=Trichodelitschia bisporula TaxID=703511 RepID=A0A6G1HK56_9PEZI|nr:MFS general substrate transporter [Trichodelitschia bisporula]